jgi:GntR family transcriptional regulator
MSYIRYDIDLIRGTIGLAHWLVPCAQAARFMSPIQQPSSAQPGALEPSQDVSGAGLASGAALAPPAFSPLYQQIKALILQSLQQSEWRPGDVIPSEFELAARFKVSQGTVRKAIDELAADNLLVRKQGKGTFVATHAEQQVQYRFLRLQPDLGTIQTEGPARRDIIYCKRARASAEVARLLGLRTADALIQVRRVLSFAGVPTICEDLWLPAGPFKGLSAEHLNDYTGAMYSLFETEFGVRMVRASEKLKAVLPDEQAAQLLQVAPSTPLLSVERIAYTYNDTPMELRRGLYLTDTHHYQNDLN